MITSPTFWIVLAVAVIIFWRLPARLRLGFLALTSIGYLLTIEPASVAVLIGWSLLFYLTAPMTRGDGPGAQCQPADH